MAMVGGGDQERDGFSEINVTPLTDVLLVLLIIFLITGSSITAPAHNIKLPEVMTREKASSANIVIDVTTDGKTYVGHDEIPTPQLRTHLEKLARAKQTDKVIINADQETPYGPVMTALDAARSAGLQNIALATSVDRRAEEPSASGSPKVTVEK